MSITINVAPIQFVDQAISVDEFEYSDEKYDQLLQQNRGLRFVRRFENKIIVVPLKADLPPLSRQIRTITLSEHLSLVASLARESMYRSLMERNCWILNLRPISYLVKRINLLDECLPKGVSPIKGVGVYVRWEIDFRIQNPSGKNAFVGMSINVSTTPRITLTCADLIKLNVPIIGYYVGKPRTKRNPELKPHFSTVGRVKAVGTDGLLLLDDIREGEDSEMLASQLYVEPREDVLSHCIKYLYGTNATSILSKLETTTSSYHTGDNKIKRLRSALHSFQKFSLALTPSCEFTIGSFLNDDNETSYSVSVGNADKPTFVFAPGGQKVNVWNDFGLKQYGPYSRESFSPSKPRICVICQVSKKGQVEQVLHKFLEGLPPVKYNSSGSTYAYTGLKAKYHLAGCVVEFFVTSDDTVEAYNKATSEAIRSHGSNQGNWNIALVQIDRSFKDRTDNNNPYLLTKARFIGQQIPVQEFTLEALSLPDERVVWSLNNMSLATYAKLNGVPWLLKADKPIAHEIVFGIGSATISEGRFGGRERMIGVTTVFTGDGSYFVSNVSSAVLEQDYFETLLQNLRTTMENVKRGLNWQPRDTVRLIFHAFKVFKEAEAEAVKKVMSELGDYNVEFAFVHVAQEHPFLIFDDKQKGLGYSKKGVLAPDRGLYIQLTGRIMLVSLTGAFELKQTTDGLPTPVQLILHQDSTFRDMTYLAKQVVNFAAHSWRSFQPAPMPVTVFYSQLVAQMLGQLSGVTHWNSDAILNKIGTTRWFL